MTTTTELPADFLTTDDVQYEAVPVPEWGGKTVVVRSLRGDERDAYEASLLTTKRKKNARGRQVETKQLDMVGIRAKLVIRSICKGVGDPTPVFDPADAGKLGQKNSAGLDRLFAVCQRLSGISDEDVEELVGN